MTDLSPELIEAVRVRRAETFIGVWNAIKQKGDVSDERLRLSKPLLNEVVEHYLMDVRVMRRRYNITDKIQLHKIAGLTTCAIMRFRPVLPLGEEFQSMDEVYSNEMFAIIHGVAICGDYVARNREMDVLSEDWFDEWYKSFRYLLHFRNYTAESIIFAYETLSRLRFQENFENLDL